MTKVVTWTPWGNYQGFVVEYEQGGTNPDGNWIGYPLSDYLITFRAQSPEQLEKLIDQHLIDQLLGLESNGCNF